MIDTESFKKNPDFNGSKGLIFIGNEIVVFRRDTKTDNYPLFVDLPGGGREGDETPFETLKRELLEEFALIIEEKDVTYSRQYPGVTDPTRQSFFFVATPVGVTEDDIIFGAEGIEYSLMTPEEFVDTEDAVPGQKQRTKDYLQYLIEHEV